MEVRRGSHGLGFVATTPISRGTIIAEYWGEIISEEEADRRGGKYLFELEGHLAIDGKSRTNVARYINHSCSPNCEPQEDRKQMRLFIVAKRAIGVGEELGYDYGRELGGTYQADRMSMWLRRQGSETMALADVLKLWRARGNKVAKTCCCDRGA